MKKTMFAAAAGAMALFGASAASADNFSPANSTFGFRGTVNVSHSISLTCTMDITAKSSVSGADASITAVSLSGFLCSLVTFSGLPWDVNVTAPATPGATATDLSISNVIATTTTGVVCGPDTIAVKWGNTTPRTIIIPTGTEINPPNAPDQTCKVAGTLSQVSGPVLSITK